MFVLVFHSFPRCTLSFLKVINRHRCLLVRHQGTCRDTNKAELGRRWPREGQIPTTASARWHCGFVLGTSLPCCSPGLLGGKSENPVVLSDHRNTCRVGLGGNNATTSVIRTGAPPYYGIRGLGRNAILDRDRSNAQLRLLRPHAAVWNTPTSHVSPGCPSQ
jgi:hypothetical protein